MWFAADRSTVGTGPERQSRPAETTMSQLPPQQPQQQGQPQQTGTSQMTAGGGQSTRTQQTPGGTGGGRLESQLYRTRNYLPEEVRIEVIRVLNRTLADATVLMTQAKFAHWNLKGREFVGLHGLFDDIAEMFEDHVDDVAERITALGGQALGTAGAAVANCQVPPIQYDAVTGMEYVDILADQLAIHDAQLHEAIDVANGYDDIDTVDLLNEVSREVSKQLWFLEAHLQNQPISTVPLAGGAGGGQMPTGGGTQFPGGSTQGGRIGQQPPTGQQGRMDQQGQRSQQGQMGQQPPTGQQGQYGPHQQGY